MKKSILLSGLTLAAFTAIAQTAIPDTVVTGSGYGTNVWYSLENDDQGSAPATNWDIAIAATAAMSNPLTTSIFFNPKQGTIYEVPGADISDFATIDTTGLSGWTALYNSDTSWAEGALNRGSSTYGWGEYTGNPDHNVAGDKIFLIKHDDTTFVKFHVTLVTLEKKYVLTYDDLDNSDLRSDTINVDDYATKNFVYFSFTDQAIRDREPAKDSWDILFCQYTSSSEPYMNSYTQTVGGVLQNVGVEVAQANDIADQDTYTDYNAHTFSKKINIIGFDWKSVDMSNPPYPWILDDSVVYFVKPANGDIWKVVFTGFGGSTSGEYIFNKTKLYTNTSAVDAFTHNIASTALYPNPAAGQQVTLIYSFNTEVSDARMILSDMAGRMVRNESLNTTNGLHQHTLSTSGLNAGVYIVNLVTDKGHTQQKLIVQ